MILIRVRWTRLAALASLVIIISSSNGGAASTLQEKHVGPAQTVDKDGWKSLFDGKSLEGWKKTDFREGGEVRVEKAFRNEGPALVLDPGSRLSGFQYADGKDLPKTDYEITLEAMKTKGSDFFCGLTFPVGKSHATLVLGGWGGGVVGISSIDNSDASENTTTQYHNFMMDRWYKIRVRVTEKKIEAWLDDKQIIDQEITGKKVSLRPGDISMQVPLGISTYQTSAAYRAIKLRELNKK
jgi:hypothetical protein